MFLGIAFLLYYFKMSGSTGFWTNMRNTDNSLHKTALAYQRDIRKLRKAELDLRFCYQCVENNVCPKFIKWTNVKRLRPKLRDSYFKRIFQDNIREKKQQIADLRSKTATKVNVLHNSTTWMKYQIIKFSINRLLDHEATKITKRHQRKLDALIINKRIHDGVKENPNDLITNLAGVELTPDEIDVLKLGIR